VSHQTPPKHTPLDPKDPFDQRWFHIEGAVLRLLRARLKFDDEACDALTDVYLEMRDRANTGTILDLQSYALGMAKNIAAARIRNRSLHLRLNLRFVEEQSAARGDADELTPERICDGLQEFERTGRVFEQLPAETRGICEADACGETAQAIAERFGLELHTVYRQLRITRQWLRRKLGLARDRKP
jgi:DNA-directed RNA polymerase specialized sigma24 family protein